MTQETDGPFWLSEDSIGEVRLSGPARLIEAWPAPTVRPTHFIETLFLEWLPAVYAVSGWWVLGASAVTSLDGASAVAFAGASRCGKSTLARALHKSGSWRQLADDTLSFDLVGEHPRLLPMPNRVHLDAPVADRLGQDPAQPSEIEWPAVAPRLEAIYLLDEPAHASGRAGIVPAGLTDAWETLIGPASRLTLPDADLLSALSEALRELVASVRIFRLSFSKDLEQLDVLSAGVARHALEVIRQAESLRRLRDLRQPWMNA